MQLSGWFLAGLVVGAVGCAASGDGGGGARGDLGKADLFGSCSAATCGEPSSDGNCYCDDECAGHGDCCADKATVCPGGTMFASYNAGLAHGAVPFADERLQPIIDEIKQSPADVLCMEEVWTDHDADALMAGVAGTFPYTFREKTENDSSKWLACGPLQWPRLFSMNKCVSNKCAPNGISAFECAADQCAGEWNALDEQCKLCLSANADSPMTCAAWKAPMYANDGRNGILLLSKKPLENVSYTPFETYVIKRGVIRADVGGYQVQCTHMTADLDVVPYPSDAKYKSWHDEHAAEVAVMSKQAGTRRRTVLLGDLNTGPASAGVDGELPDNFKTVIAAGYKDTWTSGQVCTYCQSNPLACSKPGGCGGLSSRLDHALLRGFDASVELDFQLFANEPITIKDKDGKSHDGRLSDHYGIIATMPY